MGRHILGAIAAGVWLLTGAASAQQAGAARDLFLAGPETYAPRYDRSPDPSTDRQRFPRGYNLLPPEQAVDVYVPPPVSRPSYLRRSKPEPDGYLELFVRPRTAQVYVDGLYLGLVDDYSSGERGPSLAPGPHRVELRAEGYEDVTFDVRMLPNEIISVRKDLVRVDDRPEAPPASPIVRHAAPRTFYVIPRCYAGDTPPRAAQLPAGCDAASVRVVPPF
jgi:hypothetical protein